MSTSTIVFIVICVLLLAWGIYLLYKYLKDRDLDAIREDVYKLFLKAEQKFASGEGAEKMAWVLDKARTLLPGWLQWILSDDALQRILEAWFLGIEDLLDDGKINGSAKKTDDDEEEAEDIETEDEETNEDSEEEGAE